MTSPAQCAAASVGPGYSDLRPASEVPPPVPEIKDGTIVAISSMEGLWRVMDLEAILDDECVPRDVAVRVLRCLIYGAPSPADAELRVQQQEEMVKLLARIPLPGRWGDLAKPGVTKP